MSEQLKAALQTRLTHMKNAHLQAGPASADLRKDRLLRAVKLLSDNHSAISDALNQDFGSHSHYQSLLADMATTVTMLQHAADQLSDWMQPEAVAEPAAGVKA